MLYEVITQLQAVGQRSCAPIVRIAWNEMPRFKRALGSWRRSAEKPAAVDIDRLPGDHHVVV